MNPLFQHPEDAVMIIWRPGDDYDHVYFMFMPQVYPHHEHFKIHDWSLTVFSREATGAIKRRVPDSPAQGNVPPVGDDPIHPDQHGGDLLPEVVPIEDDSNDPLDDDNLITTLDLIQMMTMMNKNISSQTITDHHQMMTWTCQEYRTRGKHKNQVFLLPPFSDPDIPIEQIADPGPDDDPSPGPDQTSEPIRVQRKQRQISVDSTDALPKAKAKVIIKKPKVQLPGHVQSISVPSVKPIDSHRDDDDHHDPQASSSNDPSIPLPNTTPTSFTPGDFSQPDQNPSTQGTPELVPAQDDDEERTELYEDEDTPVLTEEDIAQLQEEDVDTEPYNSDHMMSVVSISLNSILLRMARNNQRLNQLSLKKF